MWGKVRHLIKTKFISSLYSAAGSFIIVSGWNWYHLAKRPHGRFVLISLVMWAALFVGYYLFVYVYTHAVHKFRRHPFWQEQFVKFLNKIYLLVSLIFIVFFIKNEFLSLIYVTAIFIIIGWRLQYYLAHHPGAEPWLKINRNLFVFALGIFLIQAILQYLSYRWYILDSNVRFYNIVFFRAWAMSCFWLVGFAISDWLFWKLRGVWRYLLGIIWSLGFILVIFLWSVNLSVLYYSGLYFSPTAWQHLRNSGGELTNSQSTLVPIFGLLILIVFFGYILRRIIVAHRAVSKRQWYYYQGAIILISLVSIFGLSSFKNTPERTVINSFLKYYRGSAEQVFLNPIIKNKLEKFGLHYDLNNFFITAKPLVYSTSSPKNLLPLNLKGKQPNIIIIFLESFRLYFFAPFKISR